MFKQLFLIAAAIFGLMNSGCATLGLNPTPPKFEINEINLQSLDFQKATFVVDGTLLNENFFDVTVQSFDYQVQAGEIELAKGALKESVNAESDVPTKVSLAFDVNFKTFNNAKKLLSGKIDKVLLSGNIRYSTILGEFQKELKSEKEIDSLFR
ncbi:MAG: hypothetical protein AB7T49_12155 [Oligoflexales bacterium]